MNLVVREGFEWFTSGNYCWCYVDETIMAAYLTSSCATIYGWSI